MTVAGRRRIVAEGWRFFAHSYAIVNQWQILSLSRYADVELAMFDLPFHGEPPPVMRGLFDQREERILGGLPRPEHGGSYDLCYRIAFPYTLKNAALSGASCARTMVFGTAEHRIVPAENLTEAPDIARLNDDPDFFVVTPSVWSSDGFLALGLEPAKVRVIPHGVEASVFSPDRRGRAALRARLGLDGFVFLNCGAMTSNKGIDVLLRAFAILLETRNDVRLVLKGNDRVYGSRELLAQYFKDMPAYTRQRLLDRTLYIGDTFSMHDMAALYQACDAYVSPYRAEGFNMPVLEAAACGLPILCTRGGPTDDFVTDRFAVRIDATLNSSPHGNWLEPDTDHLVQLMERSISDLAFQHSALNAGPAHVAANYRWDHAVQAMLAV